MKILVSLVFLLLAAGACGPQLEPAIDEGTVVARYGTVRIKNSSTSRTLTVLEPGDKVDVLERQDNWYRIRSGDVEGWMEESALITKSIEARIKEMAGAAQGLVPQNTAVLREDANFRLEPGRTSPVIRKLREGTRVEVVDRVTIPRPGSDTLLDVWLHVRPAPTEAGWVFANLVEFDVPPEIAQYTEGFTYSAVKPLNQIEDPIAGSIRWYVVGERSPRLDPRLDFDGVRVFTWNLRKHRYETAFRTKGLRGVYPMEVGQDGVNPMFRIYELLPDGKSKQAREFVMNGVIVRERKRDT